MLVHPSLRARFVRAKQSAKTGRPMNSEPFQRFSCSGRLLLRSAHRNDAAFDRHCECRFLRHVANMFMSSFSAMPLGANNLSVLAVHSNKSIFS